MLSFAVQRLPRLIIPSRETNYGSRIDYILATPGLLPWIKSCDIQPHILGSDHCPVVAQLHESITGPDGNPVYLWDLINVPGRSRDPQTAAPDPPKLAARFYTEFGAEQRLLSTFFGKRPGTVTNPVTISPATLAIQAGLSASIVNNNVTHVRVPNVSLANGRAPPEDIPVPTASTSRLQSSPTSGMPPSQTPKPTSLLASTLPQALSIDLTAENTDEDIEKQPRASSSKLTASPAASGPVLTGESLKKANISAKKAKKGQQTLAGFFRPSTPVPAVPQREKKRKASQSEAVTKEMALASAEMAHNGEEEKGSQVGQSAPQATHFLEGSPEAIEIVDNEVMASAEEDDLSALKHKALNGSRIEKGTKRRKKSPSTDSAQDSDDIREVCSLYFAQVSGVIRLTPPCLQAVSAAQYGNEQASSAWSSIFTAKVPPLCTSHGEPCKQWTVNKCA